jgi:hypothetical protein
MRKTMCPGENDVSIDKLQEVTRRIIAKEHIPLRLWSESYLEAMETIVRMGEMCNRYQLALIKIASENQMQCTVHDPDGTEEPRNSLGPYAKIAMQALKEKVS